MYLEFVFIRILFRHNVEKVVYALLFKHKQRRLSSAELSENQLIKTTGGELHRYIGMLRVLEYLCSDISSLVFN